MQRCFLIVFALFGVLTSYAHSQNDLPAWRRSQHLQHGINLSGWFAESNNYSVQQLRAYTTPTDLEHIHQLGFDHVRIPVDPSIFRCDSPWESCERIQMLDQVIKKALSLDLAVILDFHADAQYTHQLATSEQADDQFFSTLGQDCGSLFGNGRRPDISRSHERVQRKRSVPVERTAG